MVFIQVYYYKFIKQDSLVVTLQEKKEETTWEISFFGLKND